jgi:hypothetical protein
MNPESPESPSPTLIGSQPPTPAPSRASYFNVFSQRNSPPQPAVSPEADGEDPEPEYGTQAPKTPEPKKKAEEPTTPTPRPTQAASSSSGSSALQIIRDLVQHTSAPTTTSSSNNMSALTAIVNPLCATGNRKVMIFYGSTNAAQKPTIALEQRYFNNNTVPLRVGNTGVTGFSSPSNLVAFLLDDMVQVFGISTESTLAMVSPAFEPDLVKGIDKVLAGCSNGKDEGWLFTVTAGNQVEKRFINEYIVSGGQLYQNQIGAREIHESSSLAAFYDGHHRWVAFQHINRTLAVRNCATDEGKQIFSGNVVGILTHLPSRILHQQSER